MYGNMDMPTFISIPAVVVVLAPVPLPRRQRHEKRLMNGVIQTHVSPLPNSDQRSVMHMQFCLECILVQHH